MLTRQRRCLLLCLWCLLSAGTARADNLPLNDDVPMPWAERKEFGMFPVVGGDSDIGVAVGAIASLASFSEFARPYLWRLELSALISFKREGSWVFPFWDNYLKLTLPALAHNTVAMTIRVAYTKYSTLHFWGIGNAAPPTPPGVDRLFNEYKLAYPRATWDLVHTFAAPWHWRVGVDYLYETPTIYDGSKVAEAMADGSGRVRGKDPFHLGLGILGFGYDSRDDAIAPERGQYHSIAVRYAPHLPPHFPYHFGAGNLSLRVYHFLWPKHLSFAARVVGDAMVGDPPFFLLAESADGYAVGGGNGVRGVPAQRYYGKIKVYGSAELRLRFAPHKAFDQDVTWGLVGFVDAGRVWADWRRDKMRDGTGWGVHYGAGGGIRLQWGTTFLLRGDVAYSPDAAPVGFYFSVGHAF